MVSEISKKGTVEIGFALHPARARCPARKDLEVTWFPCIVKAPKKVSNEGYPDVETEYACSYSGQKTCINCIPKKMYGIPELKSRWGLEEND